MTAALLRSQTSLTSLTLLSGWLNWLPSPVSLVSLRALTFAGDFAPMHSVVSFLTPLASQLTSLSLLHSHPVHSPVWSVFQDSYLFFPAVTHLGHTAYEDSATLEGIKFKFPALSSMTLIVPSGGLPSIYAEAPLASIPVVSAWLQIGLDNRASVTMSRLAIHRHTLRTLRLPALRATAFALPYTALMSLTVEKVEAGFELNTHFPALQHLKLSGQLNAAEAAQILMHTLAQPLRMRTIALRISGDLIPIRSFATLFEEMQQRGMERVTLYVTAKCVELRRFTAGLRWLRVVWSEAAMQPDEFVGV